VRSEKSPAIILEDRGGKAFLLFHSRRRMPCHSTRGREAEWQEAEKKTMKNRRKVDSKDLP